MGQPGIQTFDPRLFETLEAEWKAIEETGTSEVVDWQERIAAMTADFVDIQSAGRWQRGPSDFFGVTRLSRNELAHSAMVAWLLDPEGRHGLGRSFLDQVITHHIPEVEIGDLHVRSVALEVQRLDTRADIVVWAHKATIIIETKVDSGEEWRQCDRLFERFSMEPGARFVFLTPSGHAPKTATGDAAGAFQPVSFRNLADHLESVLTNRADSSSSGFEVARNYLNTLRTEFR